MPNVVVIRPGCTDYDEQHRIQGSLDLPLNQRGHDQVDALVGRLSSVPIDVIYSAPSEPSLSTATALGESFGVAVKELDGIRNLDQGLWEGMTHEEVRRKFPRVYKQWQDSPESICPPQGEPVSDALNRIRQSLQKPLKKKDAIAIVASEPLATLVVCVVTGCRPDFGHACCANDRSPTFETFRVEALPESVAGAANDPGTHNGRERS